MLDNRNEDRSENDLLQHALARVGTTLPTGHELVALAGMGGAGAVYKAYDAQNCMFAVKILHPSWDESEARSLDREIEATRRIAHPGVVRTYSRGKTIANEPYVVMEYCEGQTLEMRRMSRKGGLSLAESILLSFDLLVLLEVIHKAGVVHADLKPDNVLLGPRGLKVLDFGLANVSRLSSVLPYDMVHPNAPGCVTGTLGFLAPEQVLTPNQIDARADIWAVGAILHLLLTGRLVHETSGIPDFLSRTALVQAPSILEHKAVPTPIAAVVDKALRLDPNERHANAREMRRALRGTFHCFVR